MQRAVGSIRTKHRGTRFVTPAGSGRAVGPLSRGSARRSPRIPVAARAAMMREPVGAVRRSARSLVAPGATGAATGRAVHPASIHWSTPRRALRDTRSFRAVASPR
jgi:hypothetical protein